MARYGLAAMEAFETALKLDPDNITARLGRGTSSLMAPPPFGNVDAALADLRKVVELDADGTPKPITSSESRIRRTAMSPKPRPPFTGRSN